MPIVRIFRKDTNELLRKSPSFSEAADFVIKLARKRLEKNYTKRYILKWIGNGGHGSSKLDALGIRVQWFPGDPDSDPDSDSDSGSGGIIVGSDDPIMIEIRKREWMYNVFDEDTGLNSFGIDIHGFPHKGVSD